MANARDRDEPPKQAVPRTNLERGNLQHNLRTPVYTLARRLVGTTSCVVVLVLAAMTEQSCFSHTSSPIIVFLDHPNSHLWYRDSDRNYEGGRGTHRPHR